MSLFWAYVIALVVLAAGFTATYFLGDNGYEHVAGPIRIGLIVATALFGFFITFMFPFDPISIYQIPIGIILISFLIEILTIGLVWMGIGSKDFASDDAVLCHYMHAAVSIFVFISYIIGYCKAG